MATAYIVFALVSLALVRCQSVVIGVGDRHLCEVFGLEQVLRCVGDGANGRLGHGGTDSRSVLTPVAAPLLGVRVSAVSTGVRHTCAITAVSAALHCFGGGYATGTGTAAGNHLVPALVAAPLLGVRVSAVSAGNHHTCAITEVSGALYCFGFADSGQVGYGGTYAREAPTLVAAPLLGVRVSAVSAGHMHTCAIAEASGALYCFGEGRSGRLGYGGGTRDNKLVPTLVAAPLLGVRVSAVSAGAAHTCAITEVDAELYCFGDGAHGRLGHGGTGNNLVPMLVRGPLLGVRVGAVSVHHASCAITEEKALYSFGPGEFGQLGGGGKENKLLPTLVAAPLLGKRVRGVSVSSGAFTCANANVLYCFGLGFGLLPGIGYSSFPYTYTPPTTTTATTTAATTTTTAATTTTTVATTATTTAAEAATIELASEATTTTPTTTILPVTEGRELPPSHPPVAFGMARAVMVAEGLSATTLAGIATTAVCVLVAFVVICGLVLSRRQAGRKSPSGGSRHASHRSSRRSSTKMERVKF